MLPANPSERRAGTGSRNLCKCRVQIYCRQPGVSKHGVSCWPALLGQWLARDPWCSPTCPEGRRVSNLGFLLVEGRGCPICCSHSVSKTAAFTAKWWRHTGHLHLLSVLSSWGISESRMERLCLQLEVFFHGKGHHLLLFNSQRVCWLFSNIYWGPAICWALWFTVSVQPRTRGTVLLHEPVCAC